MIGKRIEQLVSALNLTKNSFSKAIGLTNNVTIGRIINEDREPSYDILSKIAQTYGCINTRWLLTGEGDMFLNTDNHSPKTDKQNDILVDKLLKKIELQAETIGALRQEVSSLKGDISNLTSEITLKDQRSGSYTNADDAQPAIVRK